MIEFGMEAAAVTTIARYEAEAEDLVLRAARSRPVNDNVDRGERLAEIEATLVRHGVLQPGTRILLAETVSF